MQITGFHEIVYFPHEKGEIPHKEEPSNDQKEPIQMRVFREFSEFLNKNSNIFINLDDGESEITKDAIAFFVEATKQLNGDPWENKIEEVKERIQSLSHLETNWLLNDLISNLYKTSITMQIAYNGTEKKRKEFLFRTITRWNNNQELRKMLKDEKVQVSIGGILITMLPTWYTENFISK